MKGKIIKLKNGGVLIYSKIKYNNSTAVEVGFRVGAEQDEKPGIAHFLEHTLFKKTTNRTNMEVENDRNKIASLNASTGMDYLVVKFYRTNKLLKESMLFAKDILLNSVLDDEFVESEKGVIKEEFKMCKDEEDRDVYAKNYLQAVSNPKFASDIVGGSQNNVDNIQFSDLLKFKQKHFVGNNFVISVATPISVWNIKKLVNEIFVPLVEFDSNYKKPISNFDKLNVDKNSSVQIYKFNQAKTSVLLTFKLNKSEFEIYGKNYNYTFLSRFLSGSQGKLFLKLRNSGLIYKLSSDISSFKTTSLFNICFETSKDKIKDALDIIKEEINQLVNGFLDDEILLQYRKNLEFFADEKMPQKHNTVSHVNFMDYINEGKLFHLSKKQKQKLRNNVTPRGVQAVSREIFNKNGEVYVSILGDVDEKFVPDLKYFKDNFLISE